jgi:hypothetical protein
VSPAGLILLVVSIVGADEETVPSEPVTLSMVAVEARREGHPQKSFGPGLESVQRALAALNFDTFSRVSSAELPVPYGTEQQIHINSKYTLFVKPVSQTDDGRVRIRARITMKSRDGTQTVDALDTTLLIKPGTHLNLGGLKLESGELIVVVSVK